MGEKLRSSTGSWRQTGRGGGFVVKGALQLLIKRYGFALLMYMSEFRLRVPSF